MKSELTIIYRKLKRKFFKKNFKKLKCLNKEKLNDNVKNTLKYIENNLLN